MTFPSNVLLDVLAEMERQDGMWGKQQHSPDVWMSILGEEYGEACCANNQKRYAEYRDELIQVAAVAIQAVMSADNGGISMLYGLRSNDPYYEPPKDEDEDPEGVFYDPPRPECKWIDDGEPEDDD